MRNTPKLFAFESPSTVLTHYRLKDWRKKLKSWKPQLKSWGLAQKLPIQARNLQQRSARYLSTFCWWAVDVNGKADIKPWWRSWRGRVKRRRARACGYTRARVKSRWLRTAVVKCGPSSCQHTFGCRRWFHSQNFSLMADTPSSRELHFAAHGRWGLGGDWASGSPNPTQIKIKQVRQYSSWWFTSYRLGRRAVTTILTPLKKARSKHQLGAKTRSKRKKTEVDVYEFNDKEDRNFPRKQRSLAGLTLYYTGPQNTWFHRGQRLASSMSKNKNGFKPTSPIREVFAENSPRNSMGSNLSFSDLFSEAAKENYPVTKR